MKYLISFLVLFLGLSKSHAQNLIGMEEMKLKSNEFTKYVMNQGSILHDKLPVDIVSMSIEDFGLANEDSLAMIRINTKFIEYYDYLLKYQNENGFTSDQLSSIFIDSAKDSEDELTCFSDWYGRDAHIISITLACYNSEILSVKESCIAHSIQASIVNNANVAECIKSQNNKGN